ALEWCEEEWLNARLPRHTASASMPVESYELFRGLTPEEIRLIANVLEHRRYRRNEVMVEMGAEAREVFFLNRGSAIIILKLASGAQKRLGVFSAGMAFGEVGMLDQAPRSAKPTRALKSRSSRTWLSASRACCAKRRGRSAFSITETEPCVQHEKDKE